MLLDVDPRGALIGIELLNLQAVVDVDALAERYRLPASVTAAIRDTLDGMR